MNTLTFQYFSDIHLEFYNDNISKVRRKFQVPSQNSDAQFLLLAGDIGKPSQKSYATFLNDMSLQFEKVFVIAGNHEYYNMQKSNSTIDNICRELCRSITQQNVTFLQNEHCVVKDTLYIYGSTFWTHIPHERKQNIKSCIKDYWNIDDFTPTISNELHKNSVDTMTKFVHSLHKDDKCIVMTHHIVIRLGILVKTKNGHSINISMYLFSNL